MVYLALTSNNLEYTPVDTYNVGLPGFSFAYLFVFYVITFILFLFSPMINL